MKELFSGWTFSRIGGVDQVVIKKGSDIADLAELDQKLWAVLAMPTDQPVGGETLECLDGDKDGKIRVADILQTIEELKGEFASLDVLFERNDKVAPDQLKNPALREMAARLAASSAPGAEPASGRIDLAAVRKAIDAFSALPFNGDGVVLPACSDDESVAAFLKALVEAGYSAPDSSGGQGVDAANLERFHADVEAYKAWTNGAAAVSGLFASEEEGSRAVDLFRAIRAPVDDYFRRCGILDMAGSSAVMGELSALMAQALSVNLPEDAPELARLPAALPRADGILRLDGALHPSRGPAMLAFFGAVAGELSSPKAVSRAEWESIGAKMDAFAAWLGSKPRSGACALGRNVLDGVFGEETEAKARALIERDLAVAGEADSLKSLKRLLLLKRDFLRILRNFVNLEDFYVEKGGLFRAGRLFLDGRELGLCLEVRNAPAHAAMAGLSSMYLIYCDLSRKDGSRKAIVAALTAGDADNIFVGRNGVFYDAEGRDWDAVITKIVVQPISIREAFFSPYKWLVRTLEEFSMKRAANAEAANMDKMKGIAQTTASVGRPEVKPEQVVPKKIDVGTVAAIGVALGSIGAMVTSVLGLFFGLGAWMPAGVVGVFILISGPSMILAYMKLRKRNIGPLLNAEGWAVNGRLKINVPFGATLSHLASLPLGSLRLIKDPFAEKKKPWALYLVIMIILALALSYFAGWLKPLLGLPR